MSKPDDITPDNVRAFDAAVSDVIMGGRSAWDRLYDETNRMPLTADDRHDLALISGLQGQELEDWIDMTHPCAAKLWRKPQE